MLEAINDLLGIIITVTSVFALIALLLFELYVKLRSTVSYEQTYTNYFMISIRIYKNELLYTTKIKVFLVPLESVKKDKYLLDIDALLLTRKTFYDISKDNWSFVTTAELTFGEQVYMAHLHNKLNGIDDEDKQVVYVSQEEVI